MKTPLTLLLVAATFTLASAQSPMTSKSDYKKAFEIVNAYTDTLLLSAEVRSNLYSELLQSIMSPLAFNNAASVADWKIQHCAVSICAKHFLNNMNTTLTNAQLFRSSSLADYPELRNLAQVAAAINMQ